MALGDFNGDGHADALIGSPGEEVSDGPENAGVVYEKLGTSAGLTGAARAFKSGGSNDPYLDLGGSDEAKDYVGGAIVAGDLTCDGIDDAVVGVPGEDVNGSAISNAGAVMFLRGGTGDLTPVLGSITSDTAGIAGTSSADDRFGAALATGDFDGDGCDDVAIGAPGEANDAGAVTVLYGSPTVPAGPRSVQLASGAGLPDAPEHDDFLGAAVVGGDFNGDGFDDLAIGAPEENSVETDVGAVATIYGSADGLVANSGRMYMSGDGLLGDRAGGDFVGAALASGDLNHDGRDDLIIGVPGERGGDNHEDSGAILTLMGSSSGLSAGSGVQMAAGSTLPGTSEVGDFVGGAVAVGDLNGDGFDDVVVGVPGEDGNGSTIDDAGAFVTVHGSAAGLVVGSGGNFNSESLDGSQETRDVLATSLAAADINGDGRADLLASIAAEDGNGTDLYNSGAVVAVLGSPSGLTATGSRQLAQGGGELAGNSESGDMVGGMQAHYLPSTSYR